MKTLLRLLFAAPLLAGACAAPAVQVAAPGPEAGITAERLLPIVKELASDEYEGRAPGTRGEKKSVGFITERFKALGLEPGNMDGSYEQAVPLLGIKSTPAVFFSAGEARLEPKFPTEFVAMTRRNVPGMALASSEVVFVGYGVKAPEYDWDDYKGMDLRGKTLLMLVNDPPVADPKNPTVLDEKMFKGRAMTYYGRWTYKFEIASELGADAVFVIHETEPAGYPYEVVSGSWAREQFELAAPSSGPLRVAVEGWISSGTARRLVTMAGNDFDRLKASAARRDFQPVKLGVKLDARVNNELREVRSANVVAKITGSDQDRRAEHVIYTAHWDHLGMDEARAGDRIYNGAVDNASGVAALLEIAAAFKRLPRPPRRSILFLSTTAEEKGLLGALHYTEHPLHALNKTVALLNMDAMNLWGPTSDLPFLGLDFSTLERYAAAAAKAQGRELVGDPQPEKGLFFRSDHFPFAKAGVPALDLQAGMDVIGEPAGWGRRKRDEYTADDYHKPSDEVKPGWDLRGMAQDAQALFQIGLAVADDDAWPQWKPGAEFKAARERSLKQK